MEPPEIDGFCNKIIKSSKSEVIFRTNIHTKVEFELWKEKYCESTNTTLNVKRTTEDRMKFKFYQLLVCQHGGRFRSKHAKHRKENTK